MKVCLVAANDALADPRALVSRHVLERAGHEVTTITAAETQGERGVIAIERPAPSLVTRIGARLGWSSGRQTLDEALTRTAIGVNPDVYIPTGMRALRPVAEASRATGAPIVRTPKMPDLGALDLINVAPTKPEAAAPPSGLGAFHTPDDRRAAYVPEPGRHNGRRVVLCYRRSEINPGRYLEAALERSGAAVRVETERIDLSTISPDTDVVVFVEGPYPALDVAGQTDVPTLFWAHHGEHHLHANVRLADRYRADAVLLAHSWHLALWFPAPVHRFPFGMAHTLLDSTKPLADRTFDVAMVGAGLRSGGQYGRRQQLVAELEAALPAHSLGFAEQVSAEEMAALYADSRIVINEGGTRHYPITMRVFEAIGSGSVLLSDPLPGMDMLMAPERHFETLSGDVVGDVTRIIDKVDAAQEMVDAAVERAAGRHTYDHRVDELFQIAAETKKRPIAASPTLSPLANVIDRDVETQRVAQLSAPELAEELLSREVWDAAALDPERLAPAKMETVALRTENAAEHLDLLRSARRFIYIEGGGDISDYLATERPQAVTSEIDGVLRIDTMAPSYRIMDFESTDP